MFKSQLKPIDKMFINQSYSKYQKEYSIKLPNIEKINTIKNDDFFAKFLSEDLYKHKFVLYISSDLFNLNKKFVLQVLFHEFTHLADYENI